MKAMVTVVAMVTAAGLAVRARTPILGTPQRGARVRPGPPTQIRASTTEFVTEAMPAMRLIANTYTVRIQWSCLLYGSLSLSLPAVHVIAS